MGVPLHSTSRLDEVALPLLTGDLLFHCVQKKKPTAASLERWGWREFKSLPVVWFDKFAKILTL